MSSSSQGMRRRRGGGSHARALLGAQGRAPTRGQPLPPTELKPERQTELKGELPSNRGPWPFVFPCENHGSQGREPLGSQPRARSSQGQYPRWLIAENHGTFVRSRTLTVITHDLCPRQDSILLSSPTITITEENNNKIT